MAYVPSLHTVTNKPLGVAQAAPTDARSLYYDTVNFLYRPYQSVAEANTYLNLAKYRQGRFSLFMNTTGVLNGDGTYTGGSITEYWYKEGTGDGDLVLKEYGGVWGSITGTLSSQTDLNSALNGKQATLVSGTNIKTVNGTSLLGSGDVVIGGGAGSLEGTLFS